MSSRFCFKEPADGDIGGLLRFKALALRHKLAGSLVLGRFEHVKGQITR